MRQFDLLTSLPSRLSCIILQDWLSLKSVMRLESAYCCHTHRADFLDLLESDEYFIRERVTIDIGPSGNRSVCIPTMLRRFGEKMRSVEFVFSHRWGFEPEHANLVIAQCRSLIHVKVSCVEVGTAELGAILQSNPHIECLIISNSSYDEFLSSSFNTSFFDDIVLPKLNTLVVTNYIIGCKKVLGAVKMGNNIVRFDLSSCNFVGSVLLEIAVLCPQLRAVVLSKLCVHGLTDDLLKKFTALCPHIVHLDISNAHYVTNAGIVSVVQNLTSLQSLNIMDVRQLTEIGLVHIYTHCANTLHTFMFGYRDFDIMRFSAGAINALLERCPQLRTVYLDDRSNSTKNPSVFSTAAVCNLTTLVIGGGIASVENLAIIGTHAQQLQALEIDSQYVYNTLFDLVNSCQRLRKLNYNLSSRCGTSIPEVLTPAYWMNVRPGVSVTLTNKRKGNWKPTKPEAFDFESDHV